MQRIHAEKSHSVWRRIPCPLWTRDTKWWLLAQANSHHFGRLVIFRSILHLRSTERLWNQKVYFPENWKNRASGVKFWKNLGPVICPPFELSDVVLGSAY